MEFLQNLDHSLFVFINSMATHSWLDVFFPFITDLHKTLTFKVLFLVLGFSVYFWRYRKRGLLYFLMGLLSVGVSDWSASQFIKKTFERPRPYQTEGLSVIQRTTAHGFSFTSNHATNMFNLALYHSQFFPQAKAVLFALAFLTSYSRVYNGVHFPADVFGGALWGLIFAFLFFKLTRKLELLIFKRSPA
ncbi:MAG: phosphatase PAP2 family protein [Bdellovibrionales bacterium]